MTDRSIVEAATRLRRTGEPYLIATVLRGSACRKPGARMLLTRFRWIAGTVTGSCFEGDLAAEAWSRTDEGKPVVITCDAAADDDIRSGFGLGGDGGVEILLERSGAMGKLDALELAAGCLRLHKRGAIATVIASDTETMAVGARMAVIAGEPRFEDGFDPHVRELVAADITAALDAGEPAIRTYDTPFGTIDVFIEALVPSPRLFLFGTGHDAVPVAQLARALGWEVVVCSSRDRRTDRFTMADEVLVGSPADVAPRIAEADRAIAVVMNHDRDRDRACVDMLLGTNVRYIGVLGARGDVIDPRVRATAPGNTPAEIALQIASEALGACGRHQRPSSAGGSAAARIACHPAPK
ncbi:MAG: XdhC family protein [Kofleriaceae bacterium]